MPPVSRFDPAVLVNDPTRRAVVVGMLDAALAAADPGPAVTRALTGGLAPDGPAVLILAFGKASAAMAAGAAAALAGRRLSGLVVAPVAAPVPAGCELIVGGHPIPDEGSERAGRRVLELAADSPPTVPALVLVSGGASALLEAPAAGVTRADIVATTGLLLRSGASIDKVNTVRKHLSAVKGGRLGAALGRRRVVTLVVSDVVGNPLDVIGSGPTVPDPTTAADARRLLPAGAPAAVRAHLDGPSAETPKRLDINQAITVVADGSTVAQAAVAAAEHQGLAAALVSTDLTGEAREVGSRLARDAAPGVRVYAGETTVTVTGEGRGGRNQELALAAALAIEGRADVVVAALGTDGVDGPTPAAGAVVDGATVARAEAQGRSPLEHLARNDAYPLLDAAGDLLVSGPTGTNVGDLTVVWRSAAGE